MIPGLLEEFNRKVADHLQPFWQAEFWSFHSPAWWGNHWARSGLVEVISADFIKDGWQQWLRWLEICEANDYRYDPQELEMVRLDQGRNLGFSRVVARNRIGLDG